MRTATKLSAFALALAAVAGGALAVGSAVGPLDESPAPAAADHSMTGAEAVADEAHGDTGLPGLAAAANGYRLELGQDRLATATPQPFRFRILGPDGAAVTRFDVEHDKRLHLVVVRRDGSNYRHVHPEMAQDGTWSIDLTLPQAGSYRVFTDFKPEGGEKTTLGADVHAPGAYEPARYDRPTRTGTVDGYEVRLDGDLVPGREATVTATVTRNGTPVGDLEPYLGAYGHLVSLRAADLGYLHVHPLGTPGDGTTPAGPQVRFAVEVPTAGQYRLFLDFQHGGTVRTAEFTLDAAGTAPPMPAPAQAPAEPSGDDHGHGGTR
ncbi:MAG TPA: hypothetical protein VGX25_10035 [Actinophytocola sp.]|uniref:hypothetical protein n=1 Tax=Actinophytocola sp. TaxID=1872138 RepID=UPI002DDD3B35|nr:hypothetical protein [Actinophytocola sp.]HEV2779728.1 hypothetical protein [Actinophytocola sp.]